MNAALSLALGLACAGAMPPFNILPLLVISFGGLLLLLDRPVTPRAAFVYGVLWGLGFYVPSLYWISASLFVDIRQFWWLLPVTSLGLPALLSVFAGMALWIAVRFSGPGTMARLFLLPLAWTTMEWLRGHVFTGFPWLLAGYAWSGDNEILLAGLQWARWLGIYGLTWLTVFLAMAMASMFRPGPAEARLLPAGLAVFALIGQLAAGEARLVHGRSLKPTDIVIRIVGTDLPERAQWSPEVAAQDFRRVAELAAAPGADGVRVQLWPEGVVQTAVNRDERARAAIASLLPENAVALVGGFHQDGSGPDRRDWNSVFAIDAKGDIAGVYDKHHLVPLGEYVPLRWLIGIKQIAAGRFDFSIGPGPATLDLPNLPAVAPVICYEAIFPGEIVDPQKPARWIANVTDDAWFGRTLGPRQHWAIARVRAVEEGLPLARAANGGITGLFDSFGVTVAQLPLATPGHLDLPLPSTAKNFP